MISRIVVTTLGACVLIGCTTSQSVRTSADFDAVNRGVRGKVTRLTLHDGSTMDVVGVHVDTDTLSWLDRGTNTLEGIPIRDVRQVSVVHASAGALRGLLVGVIAGSAFGAVRAAVEGDDPMLDRDPLAATRDEKLRIYPVAHAVYFSLAATPIGAVLGTRRIYRFDGAGATDH